MTMCHGISTSCDGRDSHLGEVTKAQNASPLVIHMILSHVTSLLLCERLRYSLYSLHSATTQTYRRSISRYVAI